MKLRTTITCLLAATLAVPVAATANLFEDVPTDHDYADEIGWAAQFQPEALFKGFEDGLFRPEQPLTANQLVKVVERLTAGQVWTRAEIAALLFHGYHHLHPTTTTTAVPAEPANTAGGEGEFELPPLPTAPTTIPQPEPVFTERFQGDTITVQIVPPSEWAGLTVGGSWVLKNNSGDHRTYYSNIPLQQVGDRFEISVTCSRYVDGKAFDITLTAPHLSAVTSFYAVECRNLPPTTYRTFNDENLWDDDRETLTEVWRRLQSFGFLKKHILGERLFAEETGQTGRLVEEPQNVANLIGWSHKTFDYVLRRLDFAQRRYAGTPTTEFEVAEQLWEEVLREAEQQHQAARGMFREGLPNPERFKPLPPISEL